EAADLERMQRELFEDEPGPRPEAWARGEPLPDEEGIAPSWSRPAGVAAEEGSGDEDVDDLDGEEELDAESEGEDDPSGKLSESSGGEEEPEHAAPGRPPPWPHAGRGPGPGEPGFAAHARAALELRGRRDAQRSECPPLLPHQAAVAFLLQPGSPVSRLLVDQPTGSGKTREMIAVLDGFFYDRRPKIPVFPRSAVCWNFYEELLRWPSRYRDFFCFARPERAALAAGLGPGGDWRERRPHCWPIARLGAPQLRALCRELREVLEMKSTIAHGRFRPGVRRRLRAERPGCPLPGAPLRALSYASAGGSFSALGRGGRPLSAVLKFGFRGGQCPFSHKVVLLDEAHNLVRAQTLFGRQLAELRRQLEIAEGSVVAGFTGTPVSDEPASGRRLLDIFKGRSSSGCDEGFLASLAKPPPGLFPAVFSADGTAEADLSPRMVAGMCRAVELRSETLRSYAVKSLENKRHLKVYCNLASHSTAFHGRTKDVMLQRPRDWMPKLATIAAAIARRREKAAVLVSRQGGYAAMLACMRQVAARASPPFSVVGGDRLADFNDVANSRGDQIRALVADSNQFSEGVSFRAVRRLYLADVPHSACALRQQCGRVARMFGHHDLRPEERAVVVVLPVAKLPAWARSPLATWCFGAFCQANCDSAEATDLAQGLLQRLAEMGIGSLEGLKDRLHKEQGARPSCEAATATALPRETVARLLRQFGLGRKKYVADASNKNFGRLFVPLQEDLTVPCRLRPLAASLQELHCATSAAQAAPALTGRTADEAAVEALRSQLLCQASELAQLRRAAVNCGGAPAGGNSGATPAAPAEAAATEHGWASAEEEQEAAASAGGEPALVGEPGAAEAGWKLDVRQRRPLDSRAPPPQHGCGAADAPAGSLKRRPPQVLPGAAAGAVSTSEAGSFADDALWLQALDDAVAAAPLSCVVPGEAYRRAMEDMGDVGDGEVVPDVAEDAADAGEARSAKRGGAKGGRPRRGSAAPERPGTTRAPSVDGGAAERPGAEPDVAGGRKAKRRGAAAADAKKRARGSPALAPPVVVAREGAADDPPRGLAGDCERLWRRFSPAVVDGARCAARVWGNGRGGQCGFARCGELEYCVGVDGFTPRRSSARTDAWTAQSPRQRSQSS
ncbi:unnamed protein product, partial [Prorocentrum cordatum]